MRGTLDEIVTLDEVEKRVMTFTYAAPRKMGEPSRIGSSPKNS
jgi:hypothetical protein